MAARKKALELNADILTVPEVAKYLRVSMSTVYRLAESGELPAFKVGAWRFARASLDHYMRERAAITQARGKHHE